MKSAHRHQLETNVLAHRLENYVDRYRPYAGTVVGALIALIVLILVWSYVSGASSARRNSAWDSYNRALTSRGGDLDQVRLTAEEYPGTPMQQMADVTWADSQVFAAAENFIYNRAAATEALNRALGAYQNVIQSTDDKRLANRARLGLARIYEMQNQLDKAREEYLKVEGAYSEYAKLQAERLAKPDAKDIGAWLATAQPPRPTQPLGPGTPGQKLDFSAGDLDLPGGAGPNAGPPPTDAGSGASFDDLIKSMQDEPTEKGGVDPYAPAQPPEGETGAPPATDESKTDPVKEAAPPVDAKDAADGGTATPPPATEPPAKE